MKGLNRGHRFTQLGNSHGVDFDLDCDGMFYCMKIYLQENKNTKHYSLLLFLLLLHRDIHCDGWGKSNRSWESWKGHQCLFQLKHFSRIHLQFSSQLNKWPKSLAVAQFPFWFPPLDAGHHTKPFPFQTSSGTDHVKWHLHHFANHCFLKEMLRKSVVIALFFLLHSRYKNSLL